MKTTNQKGENETVRATRMKYIVRAVLLLLLAVSLFVYRDTLRDIAEGIRDVTWTEMGIGILLAFLGYLMEGLTIYVMMGTVSPRARARDGIFIAYACEFYRLATLGNGSGIAEIHYLHEKGVEPGSATVLTMIQYVMKRTAIMLAGLAGFVSLYNKEATRGLCREYILFLAAGCLITVIIIASFLCIVMLPGVTEFLSGMLDRLAVRFRPQKDNFSKWKEQLLLLNRSGKTILGQKKRMCCVTALQVGKLLSFYLIPTIFLYGEAGLGAAECVWIMAVAFMLAGVIPAPSGAGALEFVFLLFFGHFTKAGTAVPAVLFFRFATWLWPAVVGGLLLWTRRIFPFRES